MFPVVLLKKKGGGGVAHQSTWPPFFLLSEFGWTMFNKYHSQQWPYHLFLYPYLHVRRICRLASDFPASPPGRGWQLCLCLSQNKCSGTPCPALPCPALGCRGAFAGMLPRPGSKSSARRRNAPGLVGAWPSQMLNVISTTATFCAGHRIESRWRRSASLIVR